MTSLGSIGANTGQRALSTLQSNPSTGRTQRTTAAGTATSSTPAAIPAEQTGYAARAAQYGPLIGAVVGTTDLLETTLDATYDLATHKLQQLGQDVETAATQAGHSLVALGSAAAKAWTEAESAVTQGGEQLSSAAKSLASALEHGAEKVGQWIDEAV